MRKTQKAIVTQSAVGTWVVDRIDEGMVWSGNDLRTFRNVGKPRSSKRKAIVEKWRNINETLGQNC